MDAINVVGAGGIGCAVGYALRTAGAAVTFVEADAEKLDWGRAHGVAVDGKPPLPAEFVSFADWQPPADALVLLCTKCYDNAAVLAQVPEGCKLLPIQNGFDRALQARVRAEGIASFVSECIAGRTHTRITRKGKLHLGPNTAGDREGAAMVQCLAGLLCRAPFRVEVVEAIGPFKYTKLMYNAAISPLAAAAGLDNGELLRRRRLRRLFFDLLQENYAILRGAGIELGKVGPFHPSRVAAILRTPLLARALAWVFYPSLHGTYCSMSGDLPRGRTEMDNYNGHLIGLAGDIPCPLNRRVHDLVQRMVREHIAPHPAIVEDLMDGARSHPVKELAAAETQASGGEAASPRYNDGGAH
jgi:2-dehydropantoate 2-reductase